MQPIVQLSKEFRFEASHQIPNHPGKCARLHGHSWILEVAISGPVNKETGMVVDYYDIKAIVQPIVDRLDHQHLGHGWIEATSNYSYPRKVHISHSLGVVTPAFPELPTSENLLVWIASQLPTEFPWTFLTIRETCTSAAVLYRNILTTEEQ